MVKNIDLIEKVIKDNSKYIKYLSKKYRVNDEGDYEDLYQEGVLSLYSAARNYDKNNSSGASFLRYADNYIRNSMNEYIQRNSNVVKFATTHGRRNLFVNRGKIDCSNYNVEELKNRYKCSEKDITAFMSMGTVSLDEEDYVLSSDSDILGSLIDSEEWELYRNSYSVLSERELDIVKSRINGIGLKELSIRYGISIERVRQVEVNSIKKMVNYVNNV